MRLYIVGTIEIPPDSLHSWAFVGVFDDEALAVAACISKGHFVGPCLLNVEEQNPYEAWPGSYFPIRRR